jgi:hypothetical protein
VSSPIYVEFVILGNTVKATAIDSVTGLEASVIGPANAPRAAMAGAARRKLEFLAKKRT